MTMVIVFETVGLTNGQVRQLKQTEKLPRILKASSLTAFYLAYLVQAQRSLHLKVARCLRVEQKLV